MREKIRGVSLRTVFMRYLILSGSFSVIFLTGAVLLMFMLQNMGILYRASAGAQACYRAIPLVQEMAAGDFEEEAVSAPCRYVIFEKQTADSGILQTNMNGKQIEITRNSMRGIKKNFLYSTFHETVPLKDGTVCVLQFDYAVAYVNPKLQNSLPDFQVSYFITVLLAVLTGIALITGHYAQLILRETGLLTQAGERIARQRSGEAYAMRDGYGGADSMGDAGERKGIAGDGEQGIASGRKRRTGAPDKKKEYRPAVREFRAALENMEELRQETENALKQQWRAEQERKEGIAALAHDLKTPLTVIGGNAELLLEEALPEDQKLCAEMIVRNVEHVRSYVDRLRQAILMQGIEEEAVQNIFLPDFYEECCREGEVLCRQKRICLRHAAVPELFFMARKDDLHRSLMNVLDNAVRFTPEGGEITFTAEKEGECLLFTVLDGGPGFSREALQKAGHMFYTSDSGRTREGHQGLGLYFARQTAERHGGMLTVGNGETGGCVGLRISLLN